MTSWKNNNTLESRRLVEEVLDSPKKTRKVVARDEDHLRQLIMNRIKKRGPDCDLNDIDVRRITDMSYLFYGLTSYFNGDISQWDVSNVKDMRCMFDGSDFNGDISQWDVSNVEDMAYMFKGSDFNGDISQWDVSNVTDMTRMFYNSPLMGKEPSWYKA